MKKLRKTAFMLAMVMSLAIGIPVLSATGLAFADTVTPGYTDGASLTIDGFKSTHIAGTAYTLIQPAGTTVTVKNPYGISVPVTSGTFTPDVTGEYKVIYTSGNLSKEMVVNVTSSTQGIKLVEDVNSADIIPLEIGRPTGDPITLTFPSAKAFDANGNVIEDAEIIVEHKGTELTKKGEKYTFDITKDSAFGEYNFTYKYVKGGSVLAYINKTLTLSSDYDNDYDFSFKFTPTAPTSAVLGKAKELPAVQGKNIKTNDEILVHYTVKAEFGASSEDVTASCIKVNKDGKYEFTANKAGDYTITYEVKDFKGKKAKVSSSSFEIKGVKDSEKPEPVVVEPYTTITNDTYVNAEHKLANNVNINDKNILIYPIFAEDNANGFVADNLTLYREIKNTSNDVVFSEKDIDGINGKIILFNSDIDFSAYNDGDVVLNGYTKSQFHVVDTELEADTYTITYFAEDKAGEEKSISYTLKATSNFAYNDADKPEITFTENLPSAAFLGETIKFAKPTAKDVNTKMASYVDTRMVIDVTYTFYNGATAIAEVAGSEGDLLVYNETSKQYELSIPQDYTSATKVVVKASATNDNGITGTAEKTVIIESSGDTKVTELTGTIDFAGLNASYVQGKEIVLPTVSYNEDKPDYMAMGIAIKHESGLEFTALDANKNVEEVSGQTYFKVTYSNAKFTPTKAGKYDIYYTTTDAGNNVTVKHFVLNISEDPNSTEIRMSGLPTAINEGKLELGKTADLAVPTLNTKLSYEYKVVVVSGPTGATTSNHKFTPAKVGTYGLQYVATVEGRVEPIKSKIYTVEVVDTTKPSIDKVYYAPEAVKGDISIKLPGYTDISKIDLQKSKVKIASSKSSAEFQFNKLLANGETKPDSTYTILEADGTIKYSLPYDNQKYTITYTVVDIYGNEAVATYDFSVGDTVKPTLNVADDIVKTEYKLSQLGSENPLTIDIANITANDGEEYSAEYIKENIKITVKNTTTGKEFNTTTDGKYVYDIDQVGTYEVLFKLADEAGNVREVRETFEVKEDTTSTMSHEEVIGTVLIVVSVLVLAGVVVYFIVSKKKSK